MRQVRKTQLEFGKVRIEDIEVNLKSRDDSPALLIGLQHLYKNKRFRALLFELMNKYILPGISRKEGRPGMEMWKISSDGHNQAGVRL